MSNTGKEFHFMETMLDRIEIIGDAQATQEPERFCNALRDTRSELQFKVRIGRSVVWDNCRRLEKLLGSAIAWFST